jgi:hypothetical protein
MDPITALSVASSVLQVIGFAGTLISKGREFYQNADGTLAGSKDQAAAATKLSALARSLRQALPSVQPSSSSSEEVAIRSIAEECNATAAEIMNALGSMSVSGKHRAWKSFRQALKSEWSKAGITAMQTKLDSLRDQMVVHLLVILK